MCTRDKPTASHSSASIVVSNHCFELICQSLTKRQENECLRRSVPIHLYSPRTTVRIPAVPFQSALLNRPHPEPVRLFRSRRTSPHRQWQTQIARTFKPPKVDCLPLINDEPPVPRAAHIAICSRFLPTVAPELIHKCSQEMVPTYDASFPGGPPYDRKSIARPVLPACLRLPPAQWKIIKCIIQCVAQGAHTPPALCRAALSFSPFLAH